MYCRQCCCQTPRGRGARKGSGKKKPRSVYLWLLLCCSVSQRKIRLILEAYKLLSLPLLALHHPALKIFSHLKSHSFIRTLTHTPPPLPPHHPPLHHSSPASFQTASMISPFVRHSRGTPWFLLSWLTGFFQNSSCNRLPSESLFLSVMHVFFTRFPLMCAILLDQENSCVTLTCYEKRKNSSFFLNLSDWWALTLFHFLPVNHKSLMSHLEWN